VSALLGILFGLALLVASCLWWSRFSLHEIFSWGRMGLVAVAFGPAAGLLCLGTAGRNLLRLMT